MMGSVVGSRISVCNQPPIQLGLAILSCIGTVSTSESWEVTRHSVTYTVHGLTEGYRNGDQHHPAGRMVVFLPRDARSASAVLLS